jgi:hypothetical protein
MILLDFPSPIQYIIRQYSVNINDDGKPSIKDIARFQLESFIDDKNLENVIAYAIKYSAQKKFSMLIPFYKRLLLSTTRKHLLIPTFTYYTDVKIFSEYFDLNISLLPSEPHNIEKVLLHLNGITYENYIYLINKYIDLIITLNVSRILVSFIRGNKNNTTKIYIYTHFICLLKQYPVEINSSIIALSSLRCGYIAVDVLGGKKINHVLLENKIKSADCWYTACKITNNTLNKTNIILRNIQEKYTKDNHELFVVLCTDSDTIINSFTERNKFKVISKTTKFIISEVDFSLINANRFSIMSEEFSDYLAKHIPYKGIVKLFVNLLINCSDAGRDYLTTTYRKLITPYVFCCISSRPNINFRDYLKYISDDISEVVLTMLNVGPRDEVITHIVNNYGLSSEALTKILNYQYEHNKGWNL